MNYKEIFEILTKPENKKIAIFTHINPDGDCLGSGAALYHALTKLGKIVDVFCEKEKSENFDFFTKDIYNKNEFSNYDLLVAVDTSECARIGDYALEFSQHKNTMLIDHHKTTLPYAKYSLIEETASSCCEIIYKILKNNIDFDEAIAQSIYCGLLTDTGCFVHNNTTPLVHQIAADLLSYNLDIDLIHYYLMKRRTFKELQLLTLALQSLTVEIDGQVSILTITQDNFMQTDTDERDVIGVVNYGVGIDGVKYSILISEIKPNVCKISVRSKLNADSSELCGVFGGGGHKYAAGCKITGKPQSVKQKLINASREILCKA